MVKKQGQYLSESLFFVSSLVPANCFELLNLFLCQTEKPLTAIFRTMKRIKTTLHLHIILLVVSVVQSCYCETNMLVSDQPGHMQAWVLNTSNGRSEINTVHGDFLLETSFVLTYSTNRSSLISSTYARSCTNIYHNKIDEASFNLTLNQSFVFRGDTVQIGENLLSLANSGITINSSGPYYIEYHFTDAFFSHAHFSDGDYLFHLTGRTDNGVNLKAETTLTLEL